MNKRKILVVDDEPIARDNVAHVLAREGYAVDTAANGEEALSHGVWGVPTLVLMPQEEGAAAELFWGLEGLPLLREALLARQPDAAA